MQVISGDFLLSRMVMRGGVVLCLVLALLGAGCQFVETGGGAVAVKADSMTTNLVPEEIIDFESFDEDNFTCTGMAYDEADDAFWLADFGAINAEAVRQPRLVQVDKSFDHVMATVVIDGLEDGGNVQGLAYDSSTDTLWLASDSVVVNLDKDGDEIKRIGTDPICDSAANGLAYDPMSDTLWVLFYREKLVNIDKDGEVISEFAVDVKDQDHLAFTKDGRLLASVGADYTGEENYVIEIDTENGKTSTTYRVEQSYAVEGLVAHDGFLYVANDGLYHDAAIPESYVAVYKLDE